MADQVAQLYKLLQSQPVSVDILPPGFSPTPDNPHSPFEFAQNNLGIPKKVYYGLYLEAVDRLNEYLGGLTSLDDATLLSVTAVVLLVNPAHASALNIRKSLVERGHMSEKDELCICGALQLTSDGSKSSILWHHRRWLLRRIYSLPSTNAEKSPFDTLEGCKLPMDAVLAEFAVVATAGEIYPRNYHAWRHRYMCLRGAVSSCRAHPEQQAALAQLLRAEEFGLKKWTELHVADYTSMQYLCQLYAAMDECGVQHIHIHEGVEDDSDRQEEVKVEFSLMRHFMELITRYPSHEALWYALRSAYALLPNPKREMGSMEGLDDTHLQRFERWRIRFDSG